MSLSLMKKDELEKDLEEIEMEKIKDPSTNSYVNLYDPTIPVKNKVDTIVYLTNKIDMEIDLCKERASLWDSKKKLLEKAKSGLRRLLRTTMLTENVKKIKTIENTVILAKSPQKLRDDVKVPDDYWKHEIVFEDLTAVEKETLHKYLVGRLPEKWIKKMVVNKTKMDKDSIPSNYFLSDNDPILKISKATNTKK